MRVCGSEECVGHRKINMLYLDRGFFVVSSILIPLNPISCSDPLSSSWPATNLLVEWAEPHGGNQVLYYSMSKIDLHLDNGRSFTLRLGIYQSDKQS